MNPNHKVIFQMRWNPEYMQAIMTFGVVVSFLENQMLQNQSLKFFEYSQFNAEVDLKHNPFMIVDAQAIENLEVIECIVSGTPTVEGSLLEYVDHTQTLFGKR